jgi:hypothetical protein
VRIVRASLVVIAFMAGLLLASGSAAAARGVVKLRVVRGAIQQQSP